MDDYAKKLIRRVLADAKPDERASLIEGMEQTSDLIESETERAAWQLLTDEERAKAVNKSLSDLDVKRLAPYLKRSGEM